MAQAAPSLISEKPAQTPKPRKDPAAHVSLPSDALVKQQEGETLPPKPGKTVQT
jgi:hypothetical protein